MEFKAGNKEFEALNTKLNDSEQLRVYKMPYDGYRTNILPRLIGGLLVRLGNIMYGHEPSYLKFRSIEITARIPYCSWSFAVYTLLTVFYFDERKAIKLLGVARYAGIAHDNETMHLIVISHLARAEKKAGLIRHTLMPMFFAIFYFVASYIFYLARPRWSLELNYLFEQDAFEQYSRFLDLHGEELKNKPIESKFLEWYGRNPKNQYEFFRSVRNDEIIHRNQSIREIDA
ncbi:MAG: alternative oxidase [bacterium]|nr:alternative oxidase [bacterium]